MRLDINGVWKIEMLGLYGWESMATAFLQDGQYRAGGQDHYGVGTYTIDGDDVNIDVKTVVLGGGRVLFGKNASIFHLQFSGKLNENVIVGDAGEGSRSSVRFQATKVAELPGD